MKRMTVIVDESKGKHKAGEASKTPVLRPKRDQCIHLIQSIMRKNPESRVLLFSEYDGTFENVEKRLSELKIPFGVIKGTAAHIHKNFERFQSGEIRVMLLNARSFGAGLNIPMTTDIIIYHKMPTNTTMQVIGRAQRPGRTGPLCVHHLLTEEEINISV